MDKKIKLLTKSLGPERFQFNQNLASHLYSQKKIHTLCLFVATNQLELTNVLDLSFELKIPFTILGAGTKIVLNKKMIQGLIIKNRTSNIKVAAVKGKVQIKGIGIKEALVEADSGVSVGKLNNFLINEGLMPVEDFSSDFSTIGGAIFVDTNIKAKASKIKVWQAGEVIEINPNMLERIQVVLSVTFNIKAQNDMMTLT